MTDERQLKTSGIAGHLTRFLADECGAARHDRLFLIGGGGIVCALLVFMWATQGLDAATDSAGAVPGASAPVVLKTVSAGPLRAPDPPQAQGGEGSDSRMFVAADYSDALSYRPDHEAQLLEDELARIREAEALAAPEDGAAVHAVAGDPGGS
jgi:hypothetical protein